MMASLKMLLMFLMVPSILSLTLRQVPKNPKLLVSSFIQQSASDAMADFKVLHNGQDTMSCEAYSRAMLLDQMQERSHAVLKFARDKHVEFLSGLEHSFENSGNGVEQLEKRWPDASNMMEHFCPWGDKMEDHDGKWVPTPKQDMHLYFTSEEIEALDGKAQGRCLPDGHAQSGRKKHGSLEPLKLHWSGCENNKCKGMVDVARWMAQRDRSELLFLGDSIIEQKYHAASCDLLRSGCSQVQDATAIEKTTPDCRGNDCDILEEKFECDEGKVKLSVKYHAFTNYDLYVSKSGLDPRKQSGSKERLKEVISKAGVVVANQGLHGSDGVQEFLSVLEGEAHVEGEDRKPHILWADSSSQHFEGEKGLFQKKTTCVPGNPASCRAADGICMPHGALQKSSDTLPVFGGDLTLQPAVDSAFTKLNIKNVRKLHDQYLTDARWDLHPEGDYSRLRFQQDGQTMEFGDDCTHFAYTPTFYAPLWHLMLKELEQMK